MLDAVASFIYILLDISCNCNKFILGTSSFNRQGPDSEMYGQIVFQSNLHYLGNKRLWGSPHQVKWAFFDFTLSAILK